MRPTRQGISVGMSFHRSGWDRRRFLKAGAALAAGAWSGGVAQALAADPARSASPLRPFPYVDGLTFLSPDPADIRASGLSGFILDVSDGERVPGPDGLTRFVRSFEACARSITEMRRRLAEGDLPDAFLATRGSEIRDAFDRTRTGIVFQFQGAEPIGDDLSRLELFYELGLRVLQVTHHRNNAWGGGALEPSWSGLTSVGFEGVERMNELGMIPDLSHVADPTCHDVLTTSKEPVIISHGAARALVRNARCTPDPIIRGVGESGGVMGIFMMSFWLTKASIPTPESFVRQVRHVVNVGGIEAAGVSNDYTVAGHLDAIAAGNDNSEAVRSYLPWWERLGEEGVLGFDRTPEHVVIPELNNVDRMFRIHEALDRGGFTCPQIEKIMGGNWVRVLTETLG